MIKERTWRCSVCGYIHKGETPPKECPQCSSSSKEFLEFNENKPKIPSFALAIIFHHKFEKIHPFMDGNGRTGRMIMNYILLKNNLPPTIIHKKTRKEYLEAMREADPSDIWKLDEKRYKKLIKELKLKK